MAEGGRRELRIAPVMTGGTSLAVWMGGVTAELYRMIMAGEPDETRADDPLTGAYRTLLDLTATTPVVDVITGTSAGGLNGTLLAAAWRLGLPSTTFDGLRDLWLDVGELNRLMRSPNDPEPPSLLKGDEYFRPSVRKVLSDWRTASEGTMPPAPERPLDLLITVTTITGDPDFAQDDFGQRIGDVNHAHTVRFHEDDFDDRGDWIDLMATTARTSASIPGVFEPSYLPVREEPDEPAGRSSPPLDFAGLASFDQSRWAVDGGLLVNLPLGEAIDRIFAQPASGELRRVVLYVKPTPSLPDVAADERGDVPSLADSVLTAIVAPRAEGVTADIAELRRHNVRASRHREARASLLRHGVAAEPPPIDDTDATWRAYLDLRAVNSVAKMMDAIQQRLPEEVLARQPEIERTLRIARMGSLPEAPGRFQRGTNPWAWGIAPLEHGCAMFLGVVDGLLDQPLPRAAERAAAEESRVGLAEARHSTYEVVRKLRALRRLDAAFWEVRNAEFATDPPDGTTVGAWYRRVATDVYHEWPELESFGTESAYGRALAALREVWLDYGGEQTETLIHLLELGLDLGSAIASAWPHVAAVAGETLPVGNEASTADVMAASEVVAQSQPVESATASYSWGAATRLETATLVLQYRMLVGDTEPGEDAPVETLRRVLGLHVVNATRLEGALANEQILEFMQISWDAEDTVTGRMTDDKLAGTELSRLGAFLKRSWRANDWFWGRMDGANRLVLVLLDPKRLRQLRCRRADVSRALESIAVPATSTGDDREMFTEHWNERQVKVWEELAFLEDDAVPTPRALPVCAETISFALQVQIATEELPAIRESVRLSLARGGVEGDEGAFRMAYDRQVDAQRPLTPSVARNLLGRMKVGQESAVDELSGDLIARTLTQGLAVGVKALSSTRSGASFLEPVVRPLRSPTTVLHALVKSATTQSRTALALTITALAAAGALVAMSVAGVGVGAPVAAIGTTVLIAGVAWVLVRSSMWSALPLIVLLMVAGLAVVGDGLDEVITTDARRAETEPLTPATSISLSEATVRFVEGGEVVSSQRVDAGRLELVEGEAELLRPGRAGEVAPWKEIGFTKWWAIARWVLALALLGYAWRLSGRWMSHRRSRQRDRAQGNRRVGHLDRERRRLLATTMGFLVVAPAVFVNVSWLFGQVLTGSKEGVRGAAIDAATKLHEWELWVVTILLVVAGVFIGMAWDRTGTRIWKRLVAWTRFRLDRWTT